MSDPSSPLTAPDGETLIALARQAVTVLRDAVRNGRAIDFRQRDPLVMAVHRALDLSATLLRARQETEQALDDALRNGTNALRAQLETAKRARQEAEQELHRIDMLLARRPALDQPTRFDNIAKAIRCAGEGEQATIERDRLRAQLESQAAEIERLRAQHG